MQRCAAFVWIAFMRGFMQNTPRSTVEQSMSHAISESAASGQIFGSVWPRRVSAAANVDLPAPERPAIAAVRAPMRKALA